jgi:hypothetical protein
LTVNVRECLARLAVSMSDSTPDMMAGRNASSSRSSPLADKTRVHVEEEVVNVLHGEAEIFEP